MLAIVSDLHLQHTGQDAFRFCPEGYAPNAKVRRRSIARNVSAGALRLLFDEIRANALRRTSTDVELILAGDIFELYRTPLWFLGGADELHPWCAIPGPDEALRTLVIRILDAIEADNAAFFAVLRQFAATKSYTVCGTGGAADRVEVLPACVKRLSVRFIPGNHDRLVNVWPETRQRVRRLLGMFPGTPAGSNDALKLGLKDADFDAGPFPHRLDDNDFTPATYSTLVRHGHEYDRGNFGGHVDRNCLPDDSPGSVDYLAPCLGDFVTVDIVTRISLGFRAMYAAAMRVPGADGALFRDLYEALTEFDDVRPASRLGDYLAAVVRRNPVAAGAGAGAAGRKFSLLAPVLGDMDKTALAEPFFERETRRIGLSSLISSGLLHTGARELLQLVPGTTPALVSRLMALQDGGPAAEFARAEKGPPEVVVAGHTHSPDQVPLGERSFFLDSGTWRSVVAPGVGGIFGRMRAYTMVFSYSDVERAAKDVDNRCFEAWTGHLASGSIGPQVTDEGPLGNPTHRLRFLECKVVKVDEGETGNGAELRLFLGVDHQAFLLALDGAKNGVTFTVNGKSCSVATVDAKTGRVKAGFAASGAAGPIEADLFEKLDGEVWAWGLEEDLGDSILDRDDLLPWAVDFVPRGSDGEATRFQSGRGVLLLKSRSRDAFLELSYEVVAR